MHISFIPQRRDTALEVFKIGDVLTINGEAFDFSALPDDAIIPHGGVPCDFITGPVERVDGEIRLTLTLPCGPFPSPAVADPAPIENVQNGPVPIPVDTIEGAI